MLTAQVTCNVYDDRTLCDVISSMARAAMPSSVRCWVSVLFKAHAQWSPQNPRPWLYPTYLHRKEERGRYKPILVTGTRGLGYTRHTWSSYHRQYAVRSTEYAVQSTHTVHTQCTQYTQYIVRSTQYTVHGTRYTVHSTQYTIHSTQYTVHSTQYTVHSTQYTVTAHSTQYTV